MSDLPVTPAAAPAPGPWQSARVTAIRRETARAATFTLALSRPRAHLAGQHYVVRLTAPDGYRASRSYSVASPPDDSGVIELTVERLDDGEVSSYLHDVVVVGDELEVRGPIGGWFVWRGDTPALLVAGGSGVVPLMAMLRLARRDGHADLVRMVVSVRSPADLYYPDELPGPEVTVVHTRAAPPGSSRAPGRLTASDLPVLTSREPPPAGPAPGGPAPNGPPPAGPAPNGPPPAGPAPAGPAPAGPAPAGPPPAGPPPAGPPAAGPPAAGLPPGGTTAYVCGSAAFADAATDLLLAAGFAPDAVRVERFGPSA